MNAFLFRYIEYRTIFKSGFLSPADNGCKETPETSSHHQQVHNRQPNGYNGCTAALSGNWEYRRPHQKAAVHPSHIPAYVDDYHFFHPHLLPTFSRTPR